MKKQDLTDGMILETRNGERYLLTNGVMRSLETYMKLEEYSDDLRLISLKSLDIVKVYEDTGILSLQTIFEDEHLTTIYERNENKLTDREIEVLKALKTIGCEWIARDEDGELYTFFYKPEKQSFNMWIDRDDYYFPIKKKIFTLDFIKWTDKEPTRIDDLLKGVEL